MECEVQQNMLHPKKIHLHHSSGIVELEVIINTIIDAKSETTAQRGVVIIVVLWKDYAVQKIIF
jgi:hypothetical protein